MKAIIILGDGMADEAVDELGGRTPLQYAHTPCMDKLAALGRNGLLKTIPNGFHPGSEVANIAILGYDLNRVFEGRGVLEAASMGVDLQPGDMAMRCNLVCIDNGLMRSHTSGHISTAEGADIINFLNENLGTEAIRFYPGVSYRHLIVVKGGDKRLICTPPHDVPMHPVSPLMVRPDHPHATKSAELLNNLILHSQEILPNHPVNKLRQSEGKLIANSIWPWSPGYRPDMQSMHQLYGTSSGAVISAVDLIRGIGVYAGLENIPVEGATGLYNTNYEGKAQAAIKALSIYDFIYLHIEAPDEAGHEGNVSLKIQTIEDLDRRLLSPIADAVLNSPTPIALAVLPDHPTPCAIKTHTAQPVPFLIYKPGEQSDDVMQFSEVDAITGSYGIIEGNQFIKYLIN
ncbi:MAG: cofactor-independent phosphoglycerate mutase [Tannerellaceae bacterium]|jgi:2,3-bisphosphoglycerate-independent phosphoglycerate mutase|nr:cofactor-independent phosphoglycerate mutase [Tannerellaceae bacterium]